MTNFTGKLLVKTENFGILKITPAGENSSKPYSISIVKVENEDEDDDEDADIEASVSGGQKKVLSIRLFTKC